MARYASQEAREQVRETTGSGLRRGYTRNTGKERCSLEPVLRTGWLFSNQQGSTWPLANWNFWQPNVLHHGPDNGEAARFSGERVDLIGTLTHIDNQALHGIRVSLVAIHDRMKDVIRYP